MKFNPLGWCLKTSRTCSLSTIAVTCKQSSKPLPTAGMWDFGVCWMLNISESPGSPSALRGGRSWTLSPLELLADASPVESIPARLLAQQQPCLADGYPAYTLLATSARARISLGCENLVCHAGRRDAMVERARTSQANGIPLGLDDYHWYSSFAAGNAVSPLIAEWIGRHLLRGSRHDRLAVLSLPVL